MPMTADEGEKRQSIIDACRRMNELGINQGTSGNISLRHRDGMLITPTSVPYDQMRGGADRLHAVRWIVRGGAKAVERMAVSSRYHAIAGRCERGRSRPSALRHRPVDHGPSDPADPLHDRGRRRRHHSLRALCDLWHGGIVRSCRERAARPLRLPARPPRHDRDRTVTSARAVAGRRGRSLGAAISRLPADRHTSAAFAKRRSSGSARRWPAMDRPIRNVGY